MRTVEAILELWPVKFGFGIVFILILKKVVGEDALSICRTIIVEFKALFVGQKSAKRLNAACIVAVLIVVVLLILSQELLDLIELTSSLTSVQRIHELGAAATNPTLLLIIMGLIMLLSVLITLFER